MGSIRGGPSHSGAGSAQSWSCNSHNQCKVNSRQIARCAIGWTDRVDLASCRTASCQLHYAMGWRMCPGPSSTLRKVCCLPTSHVQHVPQHLQIQLLCQLQHRICLRTQQTIQLSSVGTACVVEAETPTVAEVFGSADVEASNQPQSRQDQLAQMAGQVRWPWGAVEVQIAEA